MLASPAGRIPSAVRSCVPPPQARQGPGPCPGAGRPRVDGKFLAVGEERLWLRGVTYGTFAPDERGHQYGTPQQVAADLAAMAAAGLNAVRTYTVPPRWLLDLAVDHGIWVLVGLPWEHHVAFLDERRRAASIVERVRASVSACAGHPALLGYSIANEIPASIVRWHGRRRVERFLRRLATAVKEIEAEALVTYVNFPSTEYLRLPFLDFLAFNVYLEDEGAMDGYLVRLQSLAGERPLVMAEIGFDSRRHSERRQARVLEGQTCAAFRNGCAGAFVFAWTDEWHRGGHEVVDWDFGVTDRDRRPKPALGAVEAAFASVPVAGLPELPSFSVVVCTHNGARTVDECLHGLARLKYPAYEVIVVDDGSSDDSAEIARRHDVRLISTPNRGLSAARNEGLAAATGEIVAYIDDDAVPDPDWLAFLAAAFADTDHAAVGGPNLPPPTDGERAACVANTPGGPTHVLLSDRVAEHIPGCNMAFRREALEAVGGFDERFCVAGDDVDICWRVQERGGTIGFHPAALVWHRRRATVRGFWRQQRGYGRAEALLERKWPEKYNAVGQLTWAGRLYGRGASGMLRRSRVYYGVWGTGAFQQRLEPVDGGMSSLAGAPEWYLVVLALAAVSTAGLLWTPLLAALPLLVLASAMLVAHAVAGALRADFRGLGVPRRGRLRRRALTALLHLLQPAARLAGRLGHGLSPWRRPELPGAALPGPRTTRVWLEQWGSVQQRVGAIESDLRRSGARVRRGAEVARWDLEVAAGALGAVRLRAALEEHGWGRQELRLRIWPCLAPAVTTGVPVLLVLSVCAALDGALSAAGVMVSLGVLLAVGGGAECLRAAAAASRAADAPVRAGRTAERKPTSRFVPAEAPARPVPDDALPVAAGRRA
jgi:O-antigen biosynthesis protein